MKLHGKKKFIILILLAAVIALFAVYSSGSKKKEIMEATVETLPEIEDLRITVSTTGTVAPKNRLEVMPSVAGRIESILVNEGDYVKAGKVLALMSSTERAALIDAARLQGQAALSYWQNTYKPVQIVAPIEGTVIVRDAEPGQTVNTSTAIIVISDRLIVKAQVDETDIGKVKTGQKAEIVLDAHPDMTIGGKVTHIYYESVTVNNVTVYYVEITPDEIPDEFRSGMSATLEIIQIEKKDALTLPAGALISEDGETCVMVKTGEKEPPEKRSVTTGMATEDKVEIISGLSSSDTVLMRSSSGLDLLQNNGNGKKNPFMPQRASRKTSSGTKK